MWKAESTAEDGIIAATQSVAGITVAKNGFYGLAMARPTNGNYINTLDLSIPLAAYQGRQVALEFWLRDYEDATNFGDGIWLSDDGGITYVKVFAFDFSNWSNSYGKLPPLDLDELAAQNGLSFTDEFRIRFQQEGSEDLSGSAVDGLFLDDILIREDKTIYSKPPFSDGFESGTFSPSWKWAFPIETAPITNIRSGGLVEVTDWIRTIRTGFYAVRMGRRNEGNFTVNGLDLHLDLSGLTQVELNFWVEDFGDENNTLDGLYMSDNGGKDYKKIFQFIPQNYGSGYRQFNIDIDSLAFVKGLSLSSQVVVRFQQGGRADFTGGSTNGFFLDDVTVTGTSSDNAPEIFIF